MDLGAFTKASREFTLHLQTSELPVCLGLHNCCMTVFFVCVCVHARIVGQQNKREGEKENEESAFLPSSHSKTVCHAFFAALCPRLTVHLLRLWGGGVVIQPGEKEG